MSADPVGGSEQPIGDGPSSTTGAFGASREGFRWGRHQRVDGGAELHLRLAVAEGSAEHIEHDGGGIAGGIGPRLIVSAPLAKRKGACPVSGAGSEAWWSASGAAALHLATWAIAPKMTFATSAVWEMCGACPA